MNIYKHINLSGLKGFLSVLDDEQSFALVDTVCSEMAIKEDQFQHAIYIGDSDELYRLSRQLEPLARSFQLDLVVNSLFPLTRKLEVGSVSSSDLSEFMGLLKAVNTALQKLKSKGLKSDRIKTRKR